MPLFHKSRSKYENSHSESNNSSSTYTHQFEHNVTRPKFDCQLAHGSRTHHISGFKSTKELYESIAQTFEIPVSEILFCTLNSYRLDMSKLLGNQVAYDDMIFAHVKGTKKEVELIKESETLGLTVTDNGAGFVFIKRVKPEGFMAHQMTSSNKAMVEVGDHIEKIDGYDFVGKKHLEVAMYLRNLPLGSRFILRLISPHQSEFGKSGDEFLAEM
ncbi:hypothetical protein Ciccas_009311 [Cichlidogyrus casuarinus]|uniref:PDZ domain-containing protein n=1 Tax=Cichlidogyrus casuarinus TaxID=1844966 RepID=A0ABD2PYD2_9PLAT